MPPAILCEKREVRSYVSRLQRPSRKQRQQSDAECDGAPKTMLFAVRRCVNNLKSLPSEQSRNFFGLLQVVVHRKDHGCASGADTTEQRIMLTVIAHQVDPPYARNGDRKLRNNFPTSVAAKVLRQDNFVGPCLSSSRGSLTHSTSGAHFFGLLVSCSLVTISIFDGILNSARCSRQIHAFVFVTRQCLLVQTG